MQVFRTRGNTRDGWDAKRITNLQMKKNLTYVMMMMIAFITTNSGLFIEAK